MKKTILVTLGLIGILVLASIVTVYFTEASVFYRLDPYVYQKISNQWSTFFPNYDNQSSPRINGTFTRIECQNKGLFDATFNIVIKLTNATFSENPFPQSEFVDSNTVKLSYSLHSQEGTHTDVNFIVNNDTYGFGISMQFEANQFLIRHDVANWGGQSDFYYDSLGNAIWAPAQIM
jgi:uncharacterized protein YvpB